MNRQKHTLILFYSLLALASCNLGNRGEEMPDVDFKRTGNSVIIRLEGEPDRLTPLLTVNNYSSQVLNNIFMGLVSIDPQSMAIIPSLVKSRPKVEDITEGPNAGGVAYTFEIFEEAVWDDGQPVTGNDYVFTLKALLNPRVQAAPYRPYVSLIRSVQVDPSNPKRFTVTTNEKFIQGEEYVSNTFVILPEHLYDPQRLLAGISLDELIDPDKAEALATANPKLQQFADGFSDQKYGRDPEFVSGCGPYRLQQWETGQQIVLVRKENWWGDKLSDRFPALEAYPDELIFKPIPDAVTSIAALKAEEIDVAYNIDPDGFEELKNEAFTAERYTFLTPASLAYSMIYLNTANPKLSDKRVRQAIAHAIDVQEIIDNVYNGYGERTASPVLPSVEYYNKDLAPYPFDLDKSKQLLAAAGWKDSNNNGIVDKQINGQLTELELELLIPAGRETSNATSLLIQDNARQAGIGVKPVALEGSILFDNLRQRKYEMAAAGRGIAPTLWNPAQTFHTQTGDNRTGFGNATTDKMIDDILITLDQGKRNRLYKDLQAIIYEEVPEVPLFVPTNRLVIHRRFDTEVTALYPGFIPTELKLKEAFRRELN